MTKKGYLEWYPKPIYNKKKYLKGHKKKKHYGDSNISPCKIIMFEKSCKKKTQNPSRDYYYNSIINIISSFNTSQNIIIFQKSSYKNRTIIYYYYYYYYYYLGAKIPLSLLLYSIMNLKQAKGNKSLEYHHEKIES